MQAEFREDLLFEYQHRLLRRLRGIALSLQQRGHLRACGESHGVLGRWKQQQLVHRRTQQTVRSRVCQVLLAALHVLTRLPLVVLVIAVVQAPCALVRVIRRRGNWPFGQVS